MSAGFFIDPLTTAHDRSAFASGVEPLDAYFRMRVGQDVRRRVTSCLVAVEAQNAVVAGYYTLAMSSVLLADLPDAVARKLPRYPEAPVARLGRLAVGSRFRGLKLGAALLQDAIDRVRAADVAAFALVVDAKDEAAVGFYRHHGFAALRSDQRAMFLPLGAMKS